MKELVDQAKTVPGIPATTITDYRSLLKDRSKFLALASQLRRDLGKKFDEYIYKRFGDDGIQLSKAHERIVQLPARFFITTNYDNLLERAYSMHHHGSRNINTLTYKQVGQLASCLHRKELFILKAHGDAKTEPESVILTERDYRELVYSQQGYQSFLQTIFTTNRILFLGASLDDFDLRLLLGFLFTAYHGKTPIHYALLSEQEKTEAEASALFHDFNIHVLTYNNEDQTVGVCRWLDSLVRRLRNQLEMQL